MLTVCQPITTVGREKQTVFYPITTVLSSAFLPVTTVEREQSAAFQPIIIVGREKPTEF
jgi:hypothetical protein